MFRRAKSIDQAERYREIHSHQLNIYHPTISSKLSEGMKFLTIFSVMFIPLTFIGGIYDTTSKSYPN